MCAVLKSDNPLRTMYEQLVDGMERFNEGRPFTDRERAMIGHAFYMGASAVLAVSKEGHELNEEETETRGKLMASFLNESKAYKKSCAARANQLN